MCIQIHDLRVNLHARHAQARLQVGDLVFVDGRRVRDSECLRDEAERGGSEAAGGVDGERDKSFSEMQWCVPCLFLDLA